jgi:hypothetical protein
MEYGVKGTVLADRPYVYRLTGQVGSVTRKKTEMTGRTLAKRGQTTTITGRFESLNLQMKQVFKACEDHVEETIHLTNCNSEPMTLKTIEMGFAVSLTNRPTNRLCAIPFCVQLDGSRHNYSTADLGSGNFHNAVYSDSSRPEPPLNEKGRLRSEAWAWWQDGEGVLVIKYNNENVELSVAEPFEDHGEMCLRFGGVGTCLYGEPDAGHHLLPAQTFTFGTTFYYPITGPIENAFYQYRDFLDARGHGFPTDYNPPVHWNELYDIGWFHSNAELLKQNYNRETLLKEAALARDCYCESLYLDPGWEVAEGWTMWDESRLGEVHDFIETLRKDYGLNLAFRSVLRCYQDRWPVSDLIQHADRSQGPLPNSNDGQSLWELCLCNKKLWQEKLNRILAIAKQGMRFLMVDESDWRGPCYDPNHGHRVPTTASDHLQAVHELCRELKRQCPELTIECHDPIWPWHTSIYAPSYFQQGFGDEGMYHENWGFEYMWNCINDLTTGKALALYYYNLGCNVPLYLHITMTADNDQALFFWWAASTVRHLGIGGKKGHPSVTPQGLPPFDEEKRFALYQRHMSLYRKLKPYFVRGVFHGLTENLHLHILPNQPGGVLVAFNLTQEAQVLHAAIPLNLFNSELSLPVNGCKSRCENGLLKLEINVAAMSPAIVTIGSAIAG